VYEKQKKENFINIDLIHYLFCDAVTKFHAFFSGVIRGGRRKRLENHLSMNERSKLGPSFTCHGDATAINIYAFNAHDVEVYSPFWNRKKQFRVFHFSSLNFNIAA
jgi:hypothetical protein